jgi:hypothetical protein
MADFRLQWSPHRRLSLCVASIMLAGAMSARTCAAATVTYDTAPYWSIVSAVLGGMGPGQSSTMGETFMAPAGPSVTLNDFSFRAESYYPYDGGVANLHLRAFVYSWSGNITGSGGRALGSALYLSPSLVFSPPPRPNGWIPLTANIGAGGLTLSPGQHYVMGFTLSDPADYAASQGDIEFQTVPARNPNYNPPPIPPGVDFGSGGAVWLNNGSNFAALNTTVWDTWGDIGVMAFTAHFTVVPEPSTVVLSSLGFASWIIRQAVTRRR